MNPLSASIVGDISSDKVRKVQTEQAAFWPIKPISGPAHTGADIVLSSPPPSHLGPSGVRRNSSYTVIDKEKMHKERLVQSIVREGNLINVSAEYNVKEDVDESEESDDGFRSL